MISIYSYCNQQLKDLSFVEKFCLFATDVSIATSNQINYDEILSLTNKYSNLQITYIESINEELGCNEALSKTNKPIKLYLNYNEYIESKYKNLWFDLSKILLLDVADAYAIPVVDKNLNYIRSEWSLHKDNCYRGYSITDKKSQLDLLERETNEIPLFKATPIDKTSLESGLYPYIISSSD
jgi:hypothetical protein